MGPNGGTMRMRFNDCIAKAVSNSGTEIELGGTIGGGYEIHVGDKVFYADAIEIWNAAAHHFGLEKAGRNNDSPGHDGQ